MIARQEQHADHVGEGIASISGCGLSRARGQGRACRASRAASPHSQRPVRPNARGPSAVRAIDAHHPGRCRCAIQRGHHAGSVVRPSTVRRAGAARPGGRHLAGRAPFERSFPGTHRSAAACARVLHSRRRRVVHHSRGPDARARRRVRLRQDHHRQGHRAVAARAGGDRGAGAVQGAGPVRARGRCAARCTPFGAVIFQESSRRASARCGRNWAARRGAV